MIQLWLSCLYNWDEYFSIEGGNNFLNYGTCAGITSITLYHCKSRLTLNVGRDYTPPSMRITFWGNQRNLCDFNQWKVIRRPKRESKPLPGKNPVQTSTCHYRWPNRSVIRRLLLSEIIHIHIPLIRDLRPIYMPIYKILDRYRGWLRIRSSYHYNPESRNKKSETTGLWGHLTRKTTHLQL